MKKYRLLLIPFAILLLLTPWISDIDLVLSEWGHTGDWVRYSNGFYTNDFLDFVYDWFLLPAQLTCFIAGVVFVLSYKKPSLKKYKQDALVAMLCLIIGGGILGPVLKETWGRPRPKQIVQYGGRQEFRPYYKPQLDPIEPSKSFPSGHAICGFYFFFLYFMGRRKRNKVMQYGGLSFALALGGILAVTRILQGGHFFSDVFFSLVLMWSIAFFVDRFVYEKKICAT